MKKFMLIALLLWRAVAMAQQVPSTTEQQLENLGDATEENTEDDTYLQQLQYYLLHPLNLNTATADELQGLRLLTPLQIESLLHYRKLFQNLIHIYELQAVPLWDVATIRQVLPYVTIRANENVSARFTAGDHAVLLRNRRLLVKQKGFNTALPTHFTGDRNHLLLRYRYQYRNELQYGFTADKDAGEPFFTGSRKSGFDFYSAHFFARGRGLVKAVALGDFVVNMGQGLVQWQSLAFKKSADPLAVVRQSATLVPYSAAGEAVFNRGAGVTVQKGIVEATAFFSRRSLSANIEGDSAGTYFTSFATSGLHRTLSEIRDRNSIKQTAAGGTVNVRLNRFAIGANAVRYHFSKPLQKSDEPYNLYAIKGRDWYNASINYHGVLKNMYVFGEAAVAKSGSLGFVNGLMASVDPKVDVALVHRHIAKAYQALYGNAFTEAVAPANESGLYAGITVRPAAGWRVAGYADVFTFPWLRYRVHAPSRGSDYLLQVFYQPQKNAELYVRYRQEQKALNSFGADSIIYFASPRKRQNIRLHGAYKPGRVLALKARGEVMLYDLDGKNPEKGFLFFIETGYGGLKKLKATMRLQYFSTDGYNSRIYAYESDVLYSYSVPAFFDTGWRSYVNLQYDVLKNLSVWLRFSQTIYKARETIGSGLTAIDGNKRPELTGQLLWRF